MKITVTHPYLVFPVNNAKAMKKLIIRNKKQDFDKE